MTEEQCAAHFKQEYTNRIGLWAEDVEVKTRFHLALDEFGVEYKHNRRSIIIKECPACHKNWKVWMFRPDPVKGGGRTGGQCWSCATKFSSYTLLLAYGFKESQIRAKLGIGKRSPDLSPDGWQLPDFSADLEHIETVSKIQEVEIPNYFMLIRDWTSHPAAQYAMKRGAISPISDYVFINPMTNCVSFPILFRGLLVGFQHRWIAPLDPKMKMKTDAGVPRNCSYISVGDEKDPICIVEGPFDAVAAAWFGFHGIATMGKTVTRAQAQEIAGMVIEKPPESQKVYIGFDADIPGEEGARTLARYLDAYGLEFSRVLPAKPNHKDLNSWLTELIDPLSVKEVMKFDKNANLNLLEDWAWDLPWIGDIAATEFVAPTLRASEMEDERRDDKTITNNYSWTLLNKFNKKKETRQFMTKKKGVVRRFSSYR